MHTPRSSRPVLYAGAPDLCASLSVGTVPGDGGSVVDSDRSDRPTRSASRKHAQLRFHPIARSRRRLLQIHLTLLFPFPSLHTHLHPSIHTHTPPVPVPASCSRPLRLDDPTNITPQRASLLLTPASSSPDVAGRHDSSITRSAQHLATDTPDRHAHTPCSIGIGRWSIAPLPTHHIPVANLPSPRSSY